MYFYPKAILKFYSELSREELISNINYVQKMDSLKNIYSSKIKPGNRFEIITNENGFELWERLFVLFSPVKFYKISTAVWKNSGVGTELLIEVKLLNRITIFRFLFILAIAIVPACYIYLFAGFAAILWPCFLYFASMTNFTFQVWQIEDLVIHNICNKKVKKLSV